MSVREFIGARYVPIIVGEWDNNRTYEPLMVVTYQGASYTSRQYVPVGIEITNENYWVLSANYNAQIEAYRNEVRDILPYDETPTKDSTKGVTSDGINKAIAAETTRATAAEQANTTAINAEKARAEAAEQANTTAINAEKARAEAAEQANTTAIANIGFTNRGNDKVVIFSDSTFQTNPDINNGNVLQKSVVDWMTELAPRITIDNRGVGGTDTDWLLTKLNALGTSEISDATYVIVAYGTNDWQSSREPLKVNKVSDDTMDCLYGKCLDRINVLAPKANVICVTPAFLKSTTASPDKILNQNQSGNTIQSYSDVIEFEAHKRNMACLRLDYLMGINISNYQSRMVASTSDIWVHYNQDTNRRIATMLLNCIYGAAVPSYNCSYIDVTPASWKRCVAYDYYSIINRSQLTEKTYSASGLLPDTEYWVTAYGGNRKLLCNNVLALSCENIQGVVQFPVTTNSAGSLTITAQGSNDVNLMNARLTYGRPSIYEGVYPSQSGSLSFDSTPGATVNLLNSLSIGWIEYSADSLNGSSIGAIPSRFKSMALGIAIGYMVQQGGVGIAPFSARVSGGQLYPNQNVSKVEGQKIQISCILISLDYVTPSS